MKKYLAILLVFSFIFALTACGGTKDASQTTSAPEVTEQEATPAEATAEEAATEDKAAEPATPEEETQAQQETQATPEDAATQEEPEEKKAPETTAEILEAYNNAVNGAVSSKAGYSKERYTDNANYNMGIALNTFKSLVEKFIGIGDKNKYSETVSKGQWADDIQHQYLRKSTLTENDIKNAEFKEDADGCTLTVYIKDGSSVGNKSSKQSLNALDKCGICVGNEDKDYYDHKSGPVIYDAIGGTFDSAEIKESYSNAKAVAKLDKDGNLVSLTVTFDISVDITIPVGNGTATGTSHVIYKDFKH